MADIYSLPIQGTVLTRSSGQEYQNAIQRFSELAILKPAYIIFPSAFSDIPILLKYAAAQTPPIEIAVKGGGSKFLPWASSDGGLVIDLARLNRVAVSDDKNTVTVQGGALWGDVYLETEKVDVHVVGPHFWFIGVAGFLLSGGYSRLDGDHGLGLDNVLEATVVLADGRIVKTSATEEPDLFWAIRGGGNQFGIVVELVLRAFPAVSSYNLGSLLYSGSEVEDVLRVVQEWKMTQTSKERVVFGFGRVPPDYEPTIMLMTFVTGSSSRAEKVLLPFRTAVSPIADQSATLSSLFEVSHVGDENLETMPHRIHVQAAIVADIWSDTVMEVWKRWCVFTEREDCGQTAILWEIDLRGWGKEGAVGQEETAFHVRDPHYCVIVYGRNRLPASDPHIATFVSETASYIRSANTLKTGRDLGVPLCWATGDERPEDVFGVNLERLRRLKGRYDPTGVWRKGFFLEPLF